MRAVLLSDVIYERIDGRALCDQERKLLRHLIDRGQINMATAIEVLWRDQEDGGPLSAEQCVRIVLYRIRRRLRPGWCIPLYPLRGVWRLIHLIYREAA